tara:strand:+ start:17031 stop:17966 length:936 start_codon:yes stop_codon:yes gene_type:complete
MLHTVYPKDFLGLLGLGIHQGANIAAPYSELKSQTSRNFGWEVLSSLVTQKNRNMVSILVTNGLKNSGFIVVKKAAQSSTWEIKLLLVEGTDTEVLSRAISDAINASIKNNGRRILFRIGSQSGIAKKMATFGFKSYSTESFYSLSANLRNINFGPKPDETSFIYRNKENKDDYPLFTLYNKKLPREVRLGEGITFDHWVETINSQWADADSIKDIIITKDDVLQTWIRKASFSKNTSLVKLMLPLPADVQFNPFNFEQFSTETLISLPNHCNISHRQMESWGYKYSGAYINLFREFGETVPEAAFATASL